MKTLINYVITCKSLDCPQLFYSAYTSNRKAGLSKDQALKDAAGLLIDCAIYNRENWKTVAKMVL